VTAFQIAHISSKGGGGGWLAGADTVIQAGSGIDLLAHDIPVEILLIGQMPEHPTDAVHRPQALLRILTAKSI
jgi:hypothetical protein